MKKLVPFKKEIIFKTNLAEITSISLEHSLHLENKTLITGEFIISGEYKITDSSTDTEAFSFNLPFDINIDDRYILDNMTVDIDDFYYEIINNNTLFVNIEVLIDKLEEKEISSDVDTNQPIKLKEEQPLQLVRDADFIEEDTDQKEIISNSTDAINDIFNNIDDNETYVTYQVYIVRENDSLETILQKYSISKEILEQYNDLRQIKLGDKIIVPQVNNVQS